MSTYDWPTALVASAFEAQLVPNVRTFSSPYGGASQSVDLLGERWRFMVELPACLRAAAGEREAFLTRLQGGSHRVRLWHMARPQPQGTIRGTPTLALQALQGADQLSVSTTAGATVRAGDLFGLPGNLLVMAAVDATASAGGQLTITLANRLRVGVASGSALTWSRPTAEFALVASEGVPVRHVPGQSQPLSCDFLEVWG